MRFLTFFIFFLTFITTIIIIKYLCVFLTHAVHPASIIHWDPRHDFVTQNMFRELKDPKHPVHYLLPFVNMPHNQMALQPRYTGWAKKSEPQMLYT